MDDLVTKISHDVEERLEKFFVLASNKLQIDKEQLSLLWKESSSQKVDKSKSKKSPYQLFFSKKRLELKEQDSTLNFGELSKQISKLWNSMTKEQQMEWVESQGIEDCSLDTLKMTEIRNLCEKKGIKKHGNRADLLKALKSNKASTAVTAQKANKIVMPNASTVDDHPVHISENVGERRTAIENTEIPDDSQDEDDFEFEDEGDSEDGTSTDSTDFDEGDSIA